MSAQRDGEPSPVKDGKRTHRFKQPIPIPSYLLAIAVGALEWREIGPRTRVWSEKEFVEQSAYEFAEVRNVRYRSTQGLPINSTRNSSFALLCRRVTFERFCSLWAIWPTLQTCLYFYQNPPSTSTESVSSRKLFHGVLSQSNSWFIRNEPSWALHDLFSSRLRVSCRLPNIFADLTFGEPTTF